jgi:hypothetical protein
MILKTQTGINAHMITKDMTPFGVERLRSIMLIETVQLQRSSHVAEEVTLSLTVLN